HTRALIGNRTPARTRTRTRTRAPTPNPNPNPNPNPAPQTNPNPNANPAPNPVTTALRILNSGRLQTALRHQADVAKRALRPSSPRELHGEKGAARLAS